MSPEFAYLLKVNVAFMLFYAFYRLFFYKDTFFKLRRTILLIFFGLAFVYPLMNFQEWIIDKEPIADVIYLYSMMLPETTVEGEINQAVDWQGIFGLVASGIYWLIIGLLLIRFFVQLGSIIWLALKSKQAVIHDTNVHLLDKPSGPFSFFRLIFIHPESHSEKELDEILTHERTHVSQWHSIDVIVSELICIGCWMNPFVWLLKREIRHNLEYLADNTVLESGYDSKSYQYHLLGLAHNKNQAAANLYNNFNVLHLKNRISMMNKKRSRSIGRTKYLIFLPLVAILMLLSNIEAVARITKELTTSIPTKEATPGIVKGIVADTNGKPIPAATIITKGTTTGTITDIDGNFTIETPDNSTLVIASPGMIEKEVKTSKEDEFFSIFLQSENGQPAQAPQTPQKKQDAQKKQPLTVVEHMPEFPGGEGELLKFIMQNVKYPVEAQTNGIQGRVIAAFVVNEDGSISDAEVLRGVDPQLDAEAVRVINAMPKWTPGRNDGKAVAVKYTVPVTFSLKRMAPEASQASPSHKIADNNDPNNPIYSHVDVMPQYPGGEGELLRTIGRSIKYPVIAQENKIQGRVIAAFTIEKDGSTSGYEVLRSVDPLLDKEAIRVISSLEKWEPGKIDGKAVRVRYVVPITFRLQGQAKIEEGEQAANEIFVVGYALDE